jgi:hypothetical protein
VKWANSRENGNKPLQSLNLDHSNLV